MYKFNQFTIPNFMRVHVKTFKNGKPYVGDLSIDDPTYFSSYPSYYEIIQVRNSIIAKLEGNNKCYDIEVHENEIKVVEVIC